MEVVKMEGAENTLFLSTFRMLKKGISELKLMLILDEVDNKLLPKKINRIDILTSSVQITTNLF